MARRIYASARRRIGNQQLACLTAAAIAFSGVYSSVIAHL